MGSILKIKNYTKDWKLTEVCNKCTVSRNICQWTLFTKKSSEQSTNLIQFYQGQSHYNNFWAIFMFDIFILKTFS